MTKVRISKKKVIVVFVILFVVTLEWLTYHLCSLSWSSIQQFDENLSVRILFVSDAQILGYHNEPYFFGFITRWDADRYLTKTFEFAKQHFNPDIVVFLGDNMDEGSIATDNHFNDYAQRFKDIFCQDKRIKYVFISGDNDIGGEGPDLVTARKSYRFKTQFEEDIPVQHKFIQFIRVNYFTDTIEKFVNSSNHKKILISHFPLIPASRVFGKRVIALTSPDLIFSGHEHLSTHYVGNRTTSELLSSERLEAHSHVWTFDLNSEVLHEIMIPTCSYRMGKKDMGYGAAVIEKNGILHYTVLWLPGRYPQLFSYLGLLVLILIVIVIFNFKRYL